jgi:CubicO group peptidase (beta-lactamase class C family)
MKLNSSILFLMLTFGCIAKTQAQTLYFPPLSSGQAWDTLSASSLGWCTSYIDSLYDFLDQNNTKGFILLKDGKIVLEKYFGTFTSDSLWYWASAGKTLTAFLIGKAQEENSLSITDTVSEYLGTGWTSCSLSQEDKITIWNQLTMTTGLDDGVLDPYCTVDSCLLCLANAGTRWAYHNAPYTLLDGVLSVATGVSLNSFTTTRLKNKTGMTGLWLQLGYNNVYYSNLRSMARFGLLAQNNFIWQNDTLLYDAPYKNSMVSSSQPLNESYGFLWWLNGKNSFMIPGSQFVFPGWLAPDAPADMIAALGKDGQVLSISKGNGLVFARMGNSPSGLVPFTICNEIWQKLNLIICTTSLPETGKTEQKIQVFPNPVNDFLNIRTGDNLPFTAEIMDITGKQILQVKNIKSINVETLKAGFYFLRIVQDNRTQVNSFIKDKFPGCYR